MFPIEKGLLILQKIKSMSEYNFRDIENKWQTYWEDRKLFQTTLDSEKPKFYVLDMFPYPSGAGLHVGHPLGYIATDIVGRFKKLKGFNVLHPMGFDAFGLPAEQYAIQTGQHPAITTEENIKRYKSQMKNIGFSYDWDRELQTCDPDFYKWTQWIFQQLYKSWYNNKSKKAEAIEDLINIFEKEGNTSVSAACDEDTPLFSANEWNAKSAHEKDALLNKYRLTYPAEALVNWCPEMGTVLANDEVKEGFSERGGYPVERKQMKQWMMRITAFADRLVDNLEKLDWSSSMKDMQTNWIGRSYGCELTFEVDNSDIKLTAFTTRPDTIYGVTYMVLAPEHELVATLTLPDHKNEVEEYVKWASNRSERERMAEKAVTGVFTGSYVINPFSGERVPLWIADYVLAGYGTGVVMAVPSSDDRDYKFAKHFNLPIINVIEGTENLENPTDIKRGKMINSGSLNGLNTEQAIEKAIQIGVDKNIAVSKVNYKIRDAVFSRQRYWGEPVPVYYKDGIPHLIPENELPLELPPVDEYKPTSEGEPPLARAQNWKYKGKYDYETTTMPGWAGSSWYFLRYMDAQNQKKPFEKDIVSYWNQVDLYIGGTEHATGHLLYSRFWNLFLYDRGFINHEEPFQKLVNQGMIQGRSSLVYREKGTNRFISKGLIDNYEVAPMHIDIKMVKDDVLDIEQFKQWRPDLIDAEFVLEDEKYHCGFEVEKMSKRLYNVVNPDDIIDEYGADTLRLYEMFLGPLEQSKPWDTKGIEGVHRFLKKLWALVFDREGNFRLTDEKPGSDELKILHKTIKKTEDDIERLSFNTAVSGFMICLNELSALNCQKREIIEKLIVLISPFAPHICEELWERLGHNESILKANYPQFEAKYLVENEFEYPIMINGKLRAKITFGLETPEDDIKSTVLAHENVQKWIEGKTVKKLIIVPKKIINVVV